METNLFDLYRQKNLISAIATRSLWLRTSIVSLDGDRLKPTNARFGTRVKLGAAAPMITAALAHWRPRNRYWLPCDLERAKHRRVAVHRLEQVTIQDLLNGEIGRAKGKLERCKHNLNRGFTADPKGDGRPSSRAPTQSREPFQSGPRRAGRSKRRWRPRWRRSKLTCATFVRIAMRPSSLIQVRGLTGGNLLTPPTSLRVPDWVPRHRLGRRLNGLCLRFQPCCFRGRKGSKLPRFYEAPARSRRRRLPVALEPHRQTARIRPWLSSTEPLTWRSRPNRAYYERRADTSEMKRDLEGVRRDAKPRANCSRRTSFDFT